MKVVEDFIHLVGNALKAFQSSLIVTDNLGERRGGRGELVWGEFGRKQTRQRGDTSVKKSPRHTWGPEGTQEREVTTGVPWQ